MTHPNPKPRLAAAAAENRSTISAERSRTLPLDLSRVARAAREAACLTQAELAAEIETRPQLVAEQEHPHQPHLPRIDHVAKAPPAYRRTIVRALAAIDGDVVHASVALVHTDHALRNAALTAEACDVLRTFSSAIADRRIDKSERETLLRELRELISAASEAEAALLADDTNDSGH